MRWRCMLVGIRLLLVFCFFLFPLAFGNQSVDPSCYFGLPDYGTYINFDAVQTFSEIYRENNYWIFDGVGFQIQNANLTITDFFETHPLILRFTVYGTGGINSTTRISNALYPANVQGATNWIYTAVNSTISIIVTHSSSQDIVVTWGTASWGGFDLYFEQGKSVGFQHASRGFTVSLHVDSGTLNGTNGDLTMREKEGELRFTCQDNMTLSMSQDSSKNVRMVVNGEVYASPVALTVGETPHIWWREEITLPFEWTMPILGVVGAFLFIVSPYYTVTQVKKGNYMNAWMYGIIMFVFGLGLIMAWLWS